MGLNLKFSLGFGDRDKKKKEQQATEQSQAQATAEPSPNYPPGVDRETQLINEAFETYLEKNKFAGAADAIMAPIRGGRSSQPEEQSLIPNSFGAINSNFPFHLLKVCENLAIYNNHISQAVENVVSLANTEVDTYFSDNVGTRQQKQMKDHLKIFRNTWYEFSEGENGLVNDLLSQIAIFGCLSAEKVVHDDLSGIKKVVKVNPFRIRFAYDAEKDLYKPLQEIAYNGTQKSSTAFPGFAELNQRTYSYIAYRRIGSIPYAIPPFFAALEALIIEADMMKGFKNMLKKMGVLGFMSVLVTAPKQKPAETDDTFRGRMLQYLEGLRPQVEAGYANGVAMGFKGVHEFNVEGNNMNVQGADGIFRITKSYIHSGVKQDPNMMGENHATTETFGRVVLAKTTKQMENYQKIVAHFLAGVEYDELVLNGFKPGFVEKIFKKAMIGDQKREEETEKLRIENVSAKYMLGIINQQTMANELGYESAALPEPLQIPGQKPAGDGEGTGSGNPTPDKKDSTAPKQEATENTKPVTTAMLGRALVEAGMDEAPQFDYYVPEIDLAPGAHRGAEFSAPVNMDGMEFTVNFHDAQLYKYAKQYTKKVNRQFAKAVNASLPTIKKALQRLGENDGLETVQQTILFHLLNNWKVKFKSEIKSTVSDTVDAVYDHYRKDKTVFEDAAGFARGRTFARERRVTLDAGQTILTRDRLAGKLQLFTVPDPTFNLLDYRAIEYSNQMDNYYLGKFITDEDTQVRLRRFIKEKYLEGGSAIGGGAAELNEFVQEFGDKVKLESWKVSRIIDTSVNKIRNAANVNYIKQAGLQEFEVVEVLDRLTCDWCQHMDGKTFSVDLSVQKLNKAINGGAAEVKKHSPFATSTKIDDFRKMDAAALQAAGFDAPSYHPKCRGRVVAVI